MSGLTNNPIELLVILGVNTTKSLENINRHIEKLQEQVKGLNLEIVIKGDTNFASALAKQLKGLKSDAEDVDEAIGNIGKGKKTQPKIFNGFEDEKIKAMRSIAELENYLKSKNYKYKVEMSIDKKGNEVVKRITADMKNSFGEIETIHIKPIVDKQGISGFKQIGSAIQNTDTFKLQENLKKAKDTLIDFGRAGKLSATEYSQFKKAIESSKTNQQLEKVITNLRQWGKDVTVTDKVKNSMSNVNIEVNKLNESMDRFMKKNARNVDLSTFGRLKDELKEIQKLSASATDIRDIRPLQNRLDRVKGQITTATTDSNDLKAFDKRAEQITKYIGKIEYTGERAKKVIQTMYQVIANTPRGDLNQLELQFKKIETIAGRLSQKKMIFDGGRIKTDNVVALNAQLERAYNMNKRYANKDMYQTLQREIAALAKSRVREASDIEMVSNKYKHLRQQINAFSAAATQESRNNMTILNQMKIALERFPIWMVASTAFYSVVRTTRAFIDTLIDIDTKLVSIEKVAGSMGMDQVFESAIESAERYGQSISSVLDAYIEFSRQGFKGQDLSTLSSAGLVTANVGEMNAQSASEYLTSALIQWNKESSEAMGKIKCPFVQRCA